MRYTIITPTISRESLIQACESVNMQTVSNWEHIVVVDKRGESQILESIAHPQRSIIYCDHWHKNFGNSCRHFAHRYARGEYVYYLDDDNVLSDNNALERLSVVTGLWAIFPIWMQGGKFFHDPPAVSKTDTGNFLVKRTLPPWPDIPDYEADGKYVEQLLKLHPYQAFPKLSPVIVMNNSLRGANK